MLNLFILLLFSAKLSTAETPKSLKAVIIQNNSTSTELSQLKKAIKNQVYGFEIDVKIRKYSGEVEEFGKLFKPEVLYILFNHEDKGRLNLYYRGSGQTQDVAKPVLSRQVKGESPEAIAIIIRFFLRSIAMHPEKLQNPSSAENSQTAGAGKKKKSKPNKSDKSKSDSSEDKIKPAVPPSEILDISRPSKDLRHVYLKISGGNSMYSSHHLFDPYGSLELGFEFFNNIYLGFSYLFIKNVRGDGELVSMEITRNPLEIIGGYIFKYFCCYLLATIRMGLDFVKVETDSNSIFISDIQDKMHNSLYLVPEVQVGRTIFSNFNFYLGIGVEMSIYDEYYLASGYDNFGYYREEKIIDPFSLKPRFYLGFSFFW
ncbi:MAG: hypothetical protein ACQES9_10545 [Myxococcota bacterium]